MSEDKTEPTVSNPIKPVVSCDFVLGLSSDSLIIEDLKRLNGGVFKVKKEQSEWKKMVVIIDEIRVTSINASVNIFADDIKMKSTMIYCDFYLEGKFKYNAWLSLESMQEYILNAKSS